MANKALAKRQKLSFRVEPSQKALRSPAALAAKLRAPGRKDAAIAQQAQQRLLRKKTAGDAG